MVSRALKSAGVHASAESFFLADSVKCYKPAKEIYQGLLEHVGKSESPRECWLISRCGHAFHFASDSALPLLFHSNPFDITGARAQGMSAVWVDRGMKGWTDAIPFEGASLRPSKIVGSLNELVEVLENQ